MVFTYPRSHTLFTSVWFFLNLFFKQKQEQYQGMGKRRNGPCKRGCIRAVFCLATSGPVFLSSVLFLRISGNEVGFSPFHICLCLSLSSSFFLQPVAATAAGNTVFKGTLGCKHWCWCQSHANNWKPVGYPAVPTQTAYKWSWSVFHLNFSII